MCFTTPLYFFCGGPGKVLRLEPRQEGFRYIAKKAVTNTGVEPFEPKTASSGCKSDEQRR
jgi:hypothetical protein